MYLEAQMRFPHPYCSIHMCYQLHLVCDAVTPSASISIGAMGRLLESDHFVTNHTNIEYI